MHFSCIRVAVKNNVFLVILFWLSKRLYNCFIQAGLEANKNLSLLTNLGWQLAKQTKSNTFPHEFSIDFVEFGQNFNRQFVKIDKNNKTHPIHTADIYVICNKNGNPIKHLDEQEEVYTRIKN